MTELKKILTVHFVDDSDDEVFLSKILFKKEKIDLEIVHSPDLDHLLNELSSKNSSELDQAIIVVDLNLPELRGNEIVNKLRAEKRYSHMTIGICSGSEDPADKKIALDCGADFFVSKPLNSASMAKICASVDCLLMEISQDKAVVVSRFL